MAVLRKMADRRRQRASQDTEDEESGASGSDSSSPARGGGSCSGSAGGGGSGSLPSQRGGRGGGLHLRRVESGGAKSAELSECVSERLPGGDPAGGGVEVLRDAGLPVDGKVVPLRVCSHPKPQGWVASEPGRCCAGVDTGLGLEV